MALIGIGVIVAIIVVVSLATGGGAPSVAGQTTGVALASTTIAAETTSPIVITLPPNPTTSTATDPVNGHPVRWMSYRDGKVTLNGAVPDQATADTITRALAGVFGTDNVIGRYTIMADIPLTDGDPLYAHDAVQFVPLQVKLDAPAMQFLTLVADLLRQNPRVTMDVNGYTDPTGKPDADLLISQFWAVIVANYLVGAGVDQARLTHTGFGAASPVASNATSAGQALNRRVEFILHHLTA